MILLSIIPFFLLVISVKSDENSKLVYTECNETISQRQFILQSEGYPNGYPNNISCNYVLKGHAMCQTEFHFQFLDFDLEQSVNCSKDRLEIIDNENLCGFLTGVRMYKTKNNHLSLKFVSDSVTPGKGFKLLVTKLPCEGNNHLNSTVSVAPKSSSGTKLNLPKCCGDFYNSRRFYLASPGFPYSNQAPSDCYYQIYRANPNICRLRIHFKYFSLGLQQGSFCDNGFLEIDGKKICGCQTGLDVISQFDLLWGNTPKIIRYKNTGYSRNNFNGFVVEVIQDECPTRYSPSLETKSNSAKGVNSEKVPEFYFYNDQLNRLSWPNSTKANTELIDDKNDKKPKVRIDYYFFKAPEYNDPPPEVKYKEPRSYIETTSNDILLSNGNDESKCHAWGTLQWTFLTKEVLWTKMPQCKITHHVAEPIGPKCYDIKDIRGFLRTPGYPNLYYRNLDCCYRFHKLGGYCGINFHVFDFDLEASPNCHKDAFILYNKYKYCGNTLFNTKFTFDLTQKQYEDIKFITDNCFCGRGFNIYFEHMPCIHTTTPYVPPMTIPTRPTTASPPIRPVCGGQITSEYFDINFPNSHEECTYNIYTSDQDVCGLKLWFLNFDLLCGTEYLLINNQQYCGNMNGQSSVIDFDPEGKVLIQYRRRTDQSLVMSSIVLRGQQLRNCLDVPAQRIQHFQRN